MNVPDIFHAGIQALLNVTPDQWENVGQLVATSGVLSPVFMAMKKVWKIQHELVVLIMVLTGCFLVAGLAYVRHYYAINPADIWAALSLVTIILYYAVYKPLHKNLLPKVAEKWLEAKLYKANKHAQTSSPNTADEVPGRVLPTDFTH